MKLIKLEGNLFRVIESVSTFEGSWTKVFVHLADRCAVDIEDINLAIAAMQENEHDVAYFSEAGEFEFSGKAGRLKAVSEELRAIRDLRSEFAFAYKLNPMSQDTRDAAHRLQSVYITLDVNSLLDVLEDANELQAA